MSSMTKNETVSTTVEDSIEKTGMQETSSTTVDQEATTSKEDDDWLDILGSGQLKKKIIREGKKDSRPLQGYICHLNIEGKLENDTIVEKEQDFEIQLGDAEVIQGLDLAVALMNIGEQALIEINARFGYGKLGRAPDIPPSATLMYIVELLSAEPEPELEELSIKQRKNIGNRKRERGNWWYLRGEHSLAIQCYRKALEYFDETQGGITMERVDNAEDSSQELLQLIEDRLKVYNNLAAAQMKIEAFDTAFQSVENVLKCQPNNVKALFRKGKILSEKGDTEKALEVLKTANKLEPENKVIYQELARVLARSKQDRNIEKNLYRRMLGQDKAETTSTNKSDSALGIRLSWGVLAGSIMAVATGLIIYRLKPF